MEEQEYEIRCGAAVGGVAVCGFRVDLGYFARKPKFHSRSCPRCGSGLVVVLAGTDTPAPGRVTIRPDGEYRVQAAVV